MTAVASLEKKRVERDLVAAGMKRTELVPYEMWAEFKKYVAAIAKEIVNSSTYEQRKIFSYPTFSANIHRRFLVERGVFKVYRLVAEDETIIATALDRATCEMLNAYKFKVGKWIDEDIIVVERAKQRQL